MALFCLHDKIHYCNRGDQYHYIAILLFYFKNRIAPSLQQHKPHINNHKPCLYEMLHQYYMI